MIVEQLLIVHIRQDRIDVGMARLRHHLQHIGPIHRGADQKPSPQRMPGIALLVEPTSTPWKVDGTPWDFGHELLAPDIDRIATRLEMSFERIPAIGNAGIKDMINGPFTFGPDGNPMIGPAPGLKNYWVAVGVMAGFCQGGGVGLTVAEWMIDGEPSIDVWAMDVARFGDSAHR